LETLAIGDAVSLSSSLPPPPNCTEVEFIKLADVALNPLKTSILVPKP
jgi:hypothetical protein